MKEYINYLQNWLVEETKKANQSGVVFGLSGGIDSACVAGLIKDRFKDNHLALILNCDSNKQDEIDALKIVKDFNLNYKIIDLTKIWKDYKEVLNSHNHMANMNLKSRLRMATLYNFAQTNNYLVLGTSNKDEIFLGYFTKFGDGSSDLLPLYDLNKIQIFELAKLLNVNKAIINKSPSAGLYEGQTDESDMGFTYQELNQYHNDKHSLSPEIISRIESLHKRNSHKFEPVKRPKPYNAGNK